MCGLIVAITAIAVTVGVACAVLAFVIRRIYRESLVRATQADLTLDD